MQVLGDSFYDPVQQRVPMSPALALEAARVSTADTSAHQLPPTLIHLAQRFILGQHTVYAWFAVQWLLEQNMHGWLRACSVIEGTDRGSSCLSPPVSARVSACVCS